MASVWQANAFENLGHEVIRYDYRQKARDLDGGIYNNNPKRDSDLIETCYNKKPDVILFSKCNKMNVEVVKKCGKVGKTVLWYMDPGNNVNSELIEKIKECNCIFCSRLPAIKVAKKYGKNVYRLQGGYDSNIHKPINVPKIRDVVFIGEMRFYRTIFKTGWDFEVINGVYNEDHSKIVSETKINLNFTNGDGVSNRIYKIMAAKGFLLSLPWRTMEEDFKVGVDLGVFETPAELRENIKYYLEHKKEREKIAQHGYETVKKYDNINYAKKILEVISK